MYETEHAWTREEAEALVGLRVLTTRPYSGITSGEKGTVTEAYRTGGWVSDGERAHAVTITWDIQPYHGTRRQDGFSRGDWEFSIVTLYDQPGDGTGWERCCRVAVEAA
jgi:hypothetical protein